MLKKYSAYFLVINMFYHHFIFFNWYLSDQQMQIERAFSLGLIAFLSAIIFILYIHVCFFPKRLLTRHISHLSATYYAPLTKCRLSDWDK